MALMYALAWMASWFGYSSGWVPLGRGGQGSFAGSLLHSRPLSLDRVLDQEVAQGMAESVPDQPNIWSDGSGEPIPHLDIEVAGAGVFAHFPANVFDNNRWGHAQDLDVNFEGSSHIFASVAGPLQTVQRAEHWGVMLALQAFSGIHIGIDNLNVLGGVAKLTGRGP